MTSIDSSGPASSGGSGPGVTRRAVVIGAGLIGGSVAAGLRQAGFHVRIGDVESSRSRAAVEMGLADEVLEWPLLPAADLSDTEVAVISVPAGSVAQSAKAVLEAGCRVVTDVASTKAAIAEAVPEPNFVPGHPMAGSEKHGLDGSRPDLFDGARWILTPLEHTSSEALSVVHRMARDLGADPIIVSPSEHDEMVAVVSHVPHLTAVALMGIAVEHAGSKNLLLQLAAGGFRDMTRIAAGHPAIWPDICIDNAPAIDRSLETLIEQLEFTRKLIAKRDRAQLLERLHAAQVARINLPSRGCPQPERLSEVRVRIDDSPGQLAFITAQAAELNINIFDIEMTHSTEGPWGLAILVVGADDAATLVQRLSDAGGTAFVGPLGSVTEDGLGDTVEPQVPESDSTSAAEAAETLNISHTDPTGGGVDGGAGGGTGDLVGIDGEHDEPEPGTTRPGAGEPGRPFVVALDGPAASGKSTVAQRLAARLGFDHLDTGAMYRAIAFEALDRGIDLNDGVSITEMASGVHIELGDHQVRLNGIDVSVAIRSKAVSRAVSIIAVHPGVRAIMRSLQRTWAEGRRGVVAEGRDIGTVVFPEAGLKVFLTATPMVRAQRRLGERSDGDVFAIAAEIAERDERDSQRSDSPMKPADDSIVVDTSEMSIDQVVEALAGMVARRL